LRNIAQCHGIAPNGKLGERRSTRGSSKKERVKGKKIKSGEVIAPLNSAKVSPTDERRRGVEMLEVVAQNQVHKQAPSHHREKVRKKRYQSKEGGTGNWGGKKTGDDSSPDQHEHYSKKISRPELTLSKT